MSEQGRWKLQLCGVMSRSGAHGELIACAYKPDHDGVHSWSTLPTFVDGQTIRERELEAEVARVRSALGALVSATDIVTMLFLIGYTATEGNGLLDLYVAREQAEVALSKAPLPQEEAKHE